MKTWKQITSEKDFKPQYVDLTIPTCYDNSDTQIITAILIEGRIDKTTIPGKWMAYDIRHSDDDMGVMAAIEANVTVNFFGTILINELLDFKDEGHISILDYGYRDWEDVAEDELTAAGISVQYIDSWNNLDTIDTNIIRCRKAQFYDELAPGKIVYVVAECDEPQGLFKVTQYTGEGPCIDGVAGLGLTPYILVDYQTGELPDDVPLDWLYPVLPKGHERYCPRCHQELLPEVHETDMDYKWYCPYCQENMFNFKASKLK